MDDFVPFIYDERVERLIEIRTVQLWVLVGSVVPFGIVSEVSGSLIGFGTGNE